MPAVVGTAISSGSLPRTFKRPASSGMVFPGQAMSRLGCVDRRSAADGDQTVTPVFPVHVGDGIDGVNRRVGFHIQIDAVSNLSGPQTIHHPKGNGAYLAAAGNDQRVPAPFLTSRPGIFPKLPGPVRHSG